MAVKCSHFDQIKQPAARTPEGCEECLKTGDGWVHLRLCETCRPRRLLRQLEKQTRDKTFPSNSARDYQIVRAGRRLGLVLYR